MKSILNFKNSPSYRFIFLLILFLIINSSCANNDVKPEPVPQTPGTSTPSGNGGLPPEPDDPNTGEVTEPDSNLITLHLIIAADTNDTQIGKSVSVDSKNMQALMRDIVSQSRGELVLRKIVLEARSVNHYNLMRAIEFPKVKENDIVIFLYAGHGHRLQSTPTRWPIMDTPGKETDFAYIIEKIKAKEPRQFIILADCCNEVVKRPSARISLMGRQMNYDAVRQMFITSNAQIAASGCIPGQYSYGDDEQGGLFTSTFISTLNKALFLDGAKWEEIFQKTRQDVVNRSGLAGKEQTPQYQRYK